MKYAKNGSFRTRELIPKRFGISDPTKVKILEKRITFKWVLFLLPYSINKCTPDIRTPSGQLKTVLISGVLCTVSL